MENEAERTRGKTRNQASTKRGCNTNAVLLIWQVLIGDGEFRGRRRVVEKGSWCYEMTSEKGVGGGKAPIRNFIIIL